jgi:hypothetical protein
VTEIITLLGYADGDELLKIIERDWKHVQGEGLEKIIRVNGIPEDPSIKI